VGRVLGLDIDLVVNPSGRELVQANSQGGDIDVKAVADDLKAEIARRPQEATRLVKEALESVDKGDRDELAQAFIRTHNDDELKSLGRQVAGKGALALAVNELAQGKVHGDEADDAKRVGHALGVDIDLEVNAGGWRNVTGVVHTALDILGFVPGLGAVPDLINAGLYAAEGNLVKGTQSALAGVPIFGDAYKAAKAGKTLDLPKRLGIKEGPSTPRELLEQASRKLLEQQLEEQISKSSNGVPPGLDPDRSRTPPK
jgi:hypothetical protein